MSTQGSSGIGAGLKLGLAAVAMAAGSMIVTGQITVPNTFVNHTSADAPQVNANFNALASNALNRTGGTMTGTLGARDIIPNADNTYALGSTSFKWKLPFIAGGSAGQFLQTDGAGTTIWATPGPILTAPCGLHLTLETGVPFSTTDQAAKTSVFVTPVLGGQCAFFDGSATWTTLTNAEVTIAVPATTATLYDVWCRNNRGTIACDTTAWTNDTTRATALALQNNVVVKSGDTTRRYMGLFRTTAVSGQTEDSVTKRYVWSYYHRARRPLQRYESTSSWPYSLSATRQANGAAANQVEVVIGVAEATLDLQLTVAAANSAGANVTVGIGEDSTSTYAVGAILFALSGGPTPLSTRLVKTPAVGRHFYSWNEWSTAAGTTTWHANTGSVGGTITAGLAGWIEG